MITQLASFVLENCSYLSRWREAYSRACQARKEAQLQWRPLNPRARFPLPLQELEEFAVWLKTAHAAQEGTEMVDQFTRALLQGQTADPICYQHLSVNGSHLRTKSYDDTRRRTIDCIVTATLQVGHQSWIQIQWVTS